MYVCLCRGVTESEIHEAIDAGHADLDALQEQLGVASCCGCCREFTEQLIEERRRPGPALVHNAGFYAA